MPGFVSEILRATSEFWVDLLPEYLGYIQPFITFFLCLFVIYRRRAPAVSLAWMLAAAFPRRRSFSICSLATTTFLKGGACRARITAPNLSSSVSAATKGFDRSAYSPCLFRNCCIERTLDGLCATCWKSSRRTRFPASGTAPSEMFAQYSNF